MNNVNDKLSKVPEVTLVFWIIKILATTLGETGGDALSMSLDLGYPSMSIDDIQEINAKGRFGYIPHHDVKIVEGIKMTFLLRFLESVFHSLSGQVLIALNIDLVDPDLAVLFNIDQQGNLVGTA